MDAKREEILARLMLLDGRAAVRLRPKFPPGRDDRWYMSFGRVIGASLYICGFGGPWANGATPEEALDNAWEDILKISRQPDGFLLIFNCASNVSIPGPDPQTWVKWDETSGAWVDVIPDEKALAVHGIPADRIRTYADHRWRADL